MYNFNDIFNQDNFMAAAKIGVMTTVASAALGTLLPMVLPNGNILAQPFVNGAVFPIAVENGGAAFAGVYMGLMFTDLKVSGGYGMKGY